MEAPVAFATLEQHKENIEPLREGRSASALAKTLALSTLDLKDSQAKERDEFEARIADAGELDDPLEPYIEYISWVHRSFPQGQNSQSCLVQLLERCTAQFRDVSYYKDDPRYLKIWMQYAKYSDAPKELFCYLARKDIGKHLATYYEEYALYLESNGRKLQANEVFQLGLEIKARPLERLRRKYMEFCDRMAANPPGENEPSSPVIPAVRQALSLKDEGELPVPISGSGVPSTSAPLHSRIEIFADPNGSSSRPANNTGGWDTLGTMASRRKENVMEARPWAGEKLEVQGGQYKGPKMSVFRDTVPVSRATNECSFSLLMQTTKKEAHAVNMEYIYGQSGEEYCLEEILAKSRNVLDKYLTRYVEKTTTITRKIPLGEQDERFEVFNALANLESPVKRPASPTMTMHTRAATDEIYEMFNQPLQNERDSDEEDEATGYSEDEEDDQDVDVDGVDSGMSDLNRTAEGLSLNEHHTDKLSKMMMTPITEVTEPFESNESGENLDGENSSLELVNPTSESLRNKLLASLPIPLTSYHNYNRCNGNYDKQESVKRALAHKNSKSFPILKFSNDMFCVRKAIGEGGYGSVYLAETGTGEQVALKIQNHSTSWEFYILSTIRERLKSQQSQCVQSVVQAHCTYVYDDETYMALDLAVQGTVLDAVNIGRQNGAGLEEAVCIFLTIQLLKAIEALHSIGIIHGDIKSDNVMMKLANISDSQWPRRYSRHDEAWNQKTISLIDFGRGIDVTLFSQDTKFIADWPMDHQDCIEMRNHKPWTHQADYHGMASVIHSMLFGKFLETVEDSTGLLRVKEPFKRYWQTDIWTELFHTLLNSSKVAADAQISLPMTHILTQLRNKLESWLESHCENNGSLKSSILKLEQDLKR